MKISMANLVINQDCQAYRGAIGIELVLTSLPGTLDISIADLIKTLDDTFREFNINRPMVILDARTEAGIDRDEWRELALILKQRGYIIIAKLDGMAFQVFAEYATVIVAYAEAGWLNYKADEIVYQQREGFPFKLPEIYSLNKDARLTIMLDKKEQNPAWIPAVIKSGLNWAIITKPAFTYEVKLI